MDNRHAIAVTGNPDYSSEPFTDFASVSPETRLDLLNLNWRERDLPERERTKHVHRLHPYLGKFVPQLVEIFLRKFAPRTVLDPFSGCGTTLVEANTLNINAVGCDISEFNTLLTNVKTSYYDLDHLDAEIKDILQRVQLSTNPGLFAQEYNDDDNAYMKAWFHPNARRELLYYRDLIPEYRYQNVLKIILSRSARSCRLTTHSDLDFPKHPQTEPYECRKHNRICQPTETAMKFLIRYSNDTIKRLKEFAHIRTNADVTIVSGDSREVVFPEHDMIITSPPYVGLIDYHGQHQYAFELLGLTERKSEEIGSAINGNSKRAVSQYLNGITHVFRNAVSSLVSGGVVVVVVHDRRDLFGGIGRALGLTTEYRFDRHVNRRTGRRSGAFFENVIIWRKGG